MATVTEFTADESRAIAEKSTIPRLLSVPLAGVGVGVAALGYGRENPWLGAAIALFTASMMFCWTSALHEAAHQTLWKNRFVSMWVGRLLGTLMWTPYSSYRETHIRHHAYLNTPRDWELWPYSDPNASLGFRRVFVWFDLLLGIAAGPIVYGRIYFHPKSPLTDPKVRRSIMLEYAGIVVVWGAIWTYTTYAGLWGEHLRCIILPMYIAAVFQTGRKFTEHLGMASYDPLMGTRTVLPQKWLLKLASWLNFDIFIHGPHHRHPRVAHNTLGSRMEDYQAENPDIKYPVYHNYWQATWAMLPSMFLNPGCGRNAGAVEDADQFEDVENFVSDVVEEVQHEPQAVR